MIALLATLVVVVVLTVLACAAGALLVVAPFLLGVDMAERRGFSTDRWGALSLVGIGLAALLSLMAHGQGWSRLLSLPVLALSWAGPGLLALLDPSQRRLGGTQGAHEH